MPAHFEQIRDHLADIAPSVTTDVTALGVKVHASTRPVRPVPVLFPPSLYLVFQGSKQLLVEGNSFPYTSGQMITLALRTPASVEITEASPEFPYRALELPFNQRLAAELVTEVGQATSGSHCGVEVHPVPAAVLDPVERLLRLRDDPVASRVLASGLTREIWFRVLTSPGGGAFAELLDATSVMSRLDRVIEWMHQHLGEPTDVDALAELANMSATSLHRHFKAATGTSPTAYYKQLRLAEARRLIAARADSIQRIAASVGYISSSHFARDYRRTFGFSPTNHRHLPSQQTSGQR